MKILLVHLVLIVFSYAQAIERQHLHHDRDRFRVVSAVQKNSISRVFKNGNRPAKPKISNGATASLGQIPFQVSIDSDTSEFCGGVIIHSSYVLTSAECAVGGKLFTIYAGVVKLHGDESSRVVVQSLDPIIHPEFNPDTFYADIALLKLSEELPLNEYISAALLPTNDDTYTNDAAWISGWGYLTADGNLSPTLMYAPVTVISNEECKNSYGSDIVESIICTRGGGSEVGECYGDGGGPLYKELSRGGPNLLIGLFSFLNTNGCGVGPDGYTRVSSYRDWILDHI